LKLLHIDSSINGEHSISRRLSADIVGQWTEDHPETIVDYLDLTVETPPHLSHEALGFRRRSGDAVFSEAEQIQNRLSESLVTQFLAADVVVIGAPLYNFSIPSQLKAWIDRIAQAGRTFKYTENGVVGLASEKTIIAALSRGGVYSGSEAGEAMEHQETYLKTVFGFFGVTDFRVVRAEGTDMGIESRSRALRTAAENIQTLLAGELQGV